MKKHNGMRPQDILVLLAVALEENKLWRNIDISRKIELSQAEVGASIYRSTIAGLIDTNKKLLRNNFFEFIVHGLKYVFPVVPSGIERGVLTAHSAEPLNKTILSADTGNLVWPYVEGKSRGQGIQPLYRTVPKIVSSNKELYELLALVDAIRVGSAREHTIAIDEIRKRLLK